MELTEDEIIEKFGKKCEHCNRNCLLRYEYHNTSTACGFNVIKQKHQRRKIQRTRRSF